MTTSSVPASSGLDATFESHQWGGNGGDGLGFVLAAENPSNPAAPTVIGERGGGLAYASAGTQGLGYGYLGVGLDVYGNDSNPSRERLGLYRPLMGHGPDSRSGRRAGPGQRGRRLLPAEQLGRRRRFRIAPWEHPGRVPGARGSGHQHHEQPGRYDRQWRSPGVSVPSGDYGVAWTPIGGSPTELHRRAPDRGERQHSEWPVPERLGQPFHRRPLSVGLRLDGATGSNDDNHEISNVVGEHPAAGARADRSDQRQRQRAAAGPRHGRLHGHGGCRHRQQRERPHQHDHDAAERGHPWHGNRDRLVVPRPRDKSSPARTRRRSQRGRRCRRSRCPQQWPEPPPPRPVPSAPR